MCLEINVEVNKSPFSLSLSLFLSQLLKKNVQREAKWATYATSHLRKSLCCSRRETCTKLTIARSKDYYCSRGPCRARWLMRANYAAPSELRFCCDYRHSLGAGIFRRARDVNSLSQHTRAPIANACSPKSLFGNRIG